MQQKPKARSPILSEGRAVEEVLLPVVQGSLHRRALPLAAAMAHEWQLPIRLIHVSQSIDSTDPELDAVLEGIRSWYPTIEVRSEHIYGSDPVKAIAGELLPHSLPVMATDHIDKWRFKYSVAEALITEAGGPVVLVGPNVTKADVRHGPLDGEIVVGLDGSIAAESALEPAVGLAKAMQHQLWLVHVAPRPAAGTAASSPNPGAYLQEVAQRYGSEVTVRWEVIHSNDPVEAIAGFAERRDARFIVASAGGRTDTTHHSMASISSGLVSVAARPVMVLKSPETPTLGGG